MSKRIRSGDKVCVIAGNDRGKTGTVLHKTTDTILVEGINVRTKHMKPGGQNKQGQIVKIEKPIHISNVKLCVEGDQPVKVRLNKAETKEKELVYDSKGKTKVYRPILKPANTKPLKTKK